MTGRREKHFTDYIVGHYANASTLSDYAESPASQVLYEIVDISDAVAHCIRNFPKKKDKTWTGASQDSLDQINSAALGTVMGHFELYQRFVFASLFELSDLIEGFDRKACAKSLNKDSHLSIDVDHLMAYRGQPAPVGQLVADCLAGWHNPDIVNKHIRAITPNVSFFSSQESKALRLLWQLRHSVVHTGGWLTLPDAQKLPELKKIGNTAIFFTDNFIEVVVRRLHRIVKNSINRLGRDFLKRIPDEAAKTEAVTKFLDVESPRQAWLK